MSEYKILRDDKAEDTARPLKTLKEVEKYIDEDLVLQPYQRIQVVKVVKGGWVQKQIEWDE